MELAVAEFDKGLVPTHGAVATAFGLLLELADSALDDALSEFDATHDDLETMRRRRMLFREKTGNDGPADFDSLYVLAFLMLRFGQGKDSRDRTGFETELEKRLKLLPNAGVGFWMPFWLPAVAGFRHRDLMFPIVAPATDDELRAYRSLVLHVRNLGSAPSEVSMSAVLWRIAALSDGLARDKGGTLARLTALRSRVTQDPATTLLERHLWNPVTAKFVNYRDALTHMVAIDPGTGTVLEVFEDAANYAIANRDDLVSVSSAIGLAVLGTVADKMDKLPAPRAQWVRAYTEHEWFEV